MIEPDPIYGLLEERERERAIIRLVSLPSQQQYLSETIPIRISKEKEKGT